MGLRRLSTTRDRASHSGRHGRLHREQEFHDLRFVDVDTATRPAARFYRLATGIEAFFDERIARIQPDQRVLELGCGINSYAWGLADRGVEVVGIDISPVAIGHARQMAIDNGTACRTSFERMDAEAMTFVDGSFDVVIGNGILHHVDLEAVLAGTMSVLRSGGWAVFREPMGHNPFVNAYRRLTPGQRTEDEHPLSAVDMKTIRRFDPTATIQHFNLIDLIALGALRSAHFDSVRSRLASVDQWGFARVPALQRYGWMVGIEIHR